MEVEYVGFVKLRSSVEGTEDMLSLDEWGGVVWWRDVEASCVCTSMRALPFKALRLVNAFPFFL